MPRILFDFDDQAYSDIRKLQQAQEASTLGQVVQVALHLYTVMHLVMSQGYEIGILRDGEVIKIIELP